MNNTRKTNRRWWAVRALLLLAPALAIAEDKQPAIPIAEINRNTPVDFEKEILPILRTSCLACHNRTTSKADLVLETPKDILKGGDSGPAVVAGKSAQSLLLGVASHQIKPTMPPRDNKAAAPNLSSDQLGLLRLWIDQGAKGEVTRSVSIQWQAPPDAFASIYALAMTPDGQYIAAGRSNQVYIYHVPTQSMSARLIDPRLAKLPAYAQGAAHRDVVYSLAVSPDGQRIASGAFGEVKIWKRPAPAPAITLPMEGQSIVAAAASADGRFIAVAGEDHQMRLFDGAGKLLKTIAGHTAVIRSLRFSSDGAKLLSASADKSIRVFNTADGAQVFQADAPAEVHGAALVGKQIVAGCADNMVRLWQVPDSTSTKAEPPKELKGHKAAVVALDVAPAGDQFVTASADGAILLWSVAKPQNPKALSHGAAVTAIAFRPDGKAFASASSNGTIKLWDGAKASTLAEYKGNVALNEAAAARQRDQAVATSDVAHHKSALAKYETEIKAQQDRVKKATDGKTAADKALAEKQDAAKKAVDAKAAAEKALADAKSGTKPDPAAKAAAEKASAEADKAAEVAQAAYQDGKGKLAEPELAKLRDKRNATRDAAAAAKAKLATFAGAGPDEARIKQATEALAAADKAISPANNEVKRAQLAAGSAANELNLANLAVKKLTDDIAEGKSAITSAEAALKQADASLAAAKDAATKADKPIRALAFHPNGTVLASAGDDQLIHTWSADGAGSLEVIPAHKAPILSLAWTKSGQILSGSADKTAVAWSLGGDWLLERTLGTGDAFSPLTDRVNALAFSPTGERLATGSGEPSRGGEVRVWDIAKGSIVSDFKLLHSDAVLSLDFSRDGRYLASSAADRFVKVIDLSTGKLVRTFEGHTHHVLGVSFKADGRTLLSASADNAVKSWDFITGERKANIGGFGKEVTAVRYIATADQALVSSGDGAVKIITDGGGNTRTFTGFNDFVYAIATTPDGRLVAAGGDDGTLRVWNGTNGQPVATFGPAKGK